MAINTGAISRALKPGVNTWFGLAYKKHPEQWSQIFDKQMSEFNFEEDVNVNGFGLGVLKPEGASISYDTHSQGWIQRYQNLTYALGFIVTREHVEDNKYMQIAKQRAEALANSMRQTKENIAANVLNRAFSNSYLGADGVRLCSTAHLCSKGGTFSNTLSTAADLSEASLEQAIIDLGGLVDDAGLRIDVMGQKLIIPRQLQFEACRILKSDLKYDTAENAINAMKNMGSLPGGVVMNTYLSDPDAWFIKTDVQDGLKLFQRRELEVENDSDFDTENMKFKASERYCVGWTDPRGIYGSPGA